MSVPCLPSMPCVEVVLIQPAQLVIGALRLILDAWEAIGNAAGRPPGRLRWIEHMIAAATAAGLTAAQWREWRERPRLRFVLEAGYALACDSDGQEFQTNAIKVTITNRGARVVSLDRIVCTFKSRSSEELTSRKEPLGLSSIDPGKATYGWVQLHAEPKGMSRLSVSVIDSIGKEWAASRRQISRLMAEYATYR